MDREQLADFLRSRRAVLQPADVGLVEGPRRRTPGLRREEVAALASMSTDYYTRLEQQRGPQPSEQMLAAIARALRLTQDERDYLFRLAGHTAPLHALRSEHVSPALMRVLDRLDTPAQVVSDLGATLAQNPLALALLGDQTAYTGNARSICFRWFTDPATRAFYPEEDHPLHARAFVGSLRAALARRGDDPHASAMVTELRRRSPEFRVLWEEHAVSARSVARKRMIHPDIGAVTLDCQTLLSENQGQALLVYTATPGSEDREKLDLLAVVSPRRYSPTP